ncbi:hypothetical protein [Flavobacterium polysaccharolyticum]|uniref:Uncharacterized protein n=1 Tax=Flavobacterium polysaccharolyticum TaxID=3133148 RepID=A0ABU9NIK1_9FLAO
MKLKKKIKQLKAEIKALKKVVKSDSITLSDQSNPNKAVVLSYVDGVLATQEVTTEVVVTVDNITNSLNQ